MCACPRWKIRRQIGTHNYTVVHHHGQHRSAAVHPDLPGAVRPRELRSARSVPSLRRGTSSRRRWRSGRHPRSGDAQHLQEPPRWGRRRRLGPQRRERWGGNSRRISLRKRERPVPAGVRRGRQLQRPHLPGVCRPARAGFVGPPRRPRRRRRLHHRELQLRGRIRQGSGAGGAADGAYSSQRLRPWSTSPKPEPCV